MAHVGLNANAFTDAYIDYDLFTLDVEAAHVAPMLTDFRPRNINLSPDDGTLFLRRDDTSICVYSIAEERCARDMDITLKF